MAKDLSIIDMYDEALRKLKERRAQAGQASAAAYEKLAGKTSADYEALDNEAYVNKALADRTFGAAGDRMATIKQRRDSNLKNTLGKNKRQRQSFEDSVNLALKNYETRQAADDAALTAQFGAAENAALVSGGNFDAQLGLRQQQLDMDKQSSRFSNAYAMYAKGLIDRKQFKEWTGYEVRNWPKPKKSNTGPAVIYVGDEPPAQNTEGYVTRTVYIASIGLTRYYEVKENLVDEMEDKGVSLQTEGGSVKNDNEIYFELYGFNPDTANYTETLEAIMADEDAFIDKFGEWTFWSVTTAARYNALALKYYFVDQDPELYKSMADLDDLYMNADQYIEEYGYEEYCIKLDVAFQTAEQYYADMIMPSIADNSEVSISYEGTTVRYQDLQNTFSDYLPQYSGSISDDYNQANGYRPRFI